MFHNLQIKMDLVFFFFILLCDLKIKNLKIKIISICHNVTFYTKINKIIVIFFLFYMLIHVKSAILAYYKYKMNEVTLIFILYFI